MDTGSAPDTGRATRSGVSVPIVVGLVVVAAGLAAGGVLLATRDDGDDDPPRVLLDQRGAVVAPASPNAPDDPFASGPCKAAQERIDAGTASELDRTFVLGCMAGPPDGRDASSGGGAASFGRLSCTYTAIGQTCTGPGSYRLSCTDTALGLVCSDNEGASFSCTSTPLGYDCS